MDFSKTIIDWYRNHKRDLPWRRSRDAYKIWLSEIILQQTRIDQGLPYYLRFVEAFPSVAELAKAEEDRVMRLWQGLGYYSRARNMHAAAKTVYQKWGLSFPRSYEELITLKGVGEYTASAIASFAGGESRAVVDGNVYRLLSRYFAIETPIDTGAGKRHFAELAQQLIDEKRPGLHNQAIMEFGALQCRPKKPLCEDCPLSEGCLALSQGKVTLLPVKAKKTKVRHRYFNYLVIRKSGRIWIRRRGAGDIWQSLYDFPLIESEAPLDETALLQHETVGKVLGDNEFSLRSVSEEQKHVLSHQVIHARFWQLELRAASPSGYATYRDAPAPPEERYQAVEEEKMDGYAFPKLIVNYLKNNL